MTNLPVFDRYQIQRELGQGGMATVYHAIDPRFQREVAIKVLPQIFLHDPSFRARFNAEARSVATLEHSAILPVYDFGEQDEQPYLVMRYMSGGSLSDRIYKERMSLPSIVKIVDRIASALDFAHRQGVIHRDVKPGNILFDSDGDAYLSDFGIAKLTESTAQLTGSGIIGTPAYMAPEMANKEGISPKSDIYALGVTIFQMLSGKLPYESDTPMGTLMAHLSHPVPDIRVLRPDLPPDVQSVIERAMAKDPVRRYGRAIELADDLGAVVSGERLPVEFTAPYTEPMDLVPERSVVGAEPIPPAPVESVPRTGASLSTAPPVESVVDIPRHEDRRGVFGMLPGCVLFMGLLLAGMIGVWGLLKLGIVSLPSVGVPVAVITDTPRESITSVINDTPTLNPNTRDIATATLRFTPTQFIPPTATIRDQLTATHRPSATPTRIPSSTPTLVPTSTPTLRPSPTSTMTSTVYVPHSPYQIVGMGISSSDVVYTWYDDNTVSAGNSWDLGSIQGPVYYSLPPGKAPGHIVGMGIGPDNRVFAWYSDNTVSSGTTTDLDAYSAPYGFSVPSGKAPVDIVGIGIAGDYHVYVWYRDNTVSAGSTGNLGDYRPPDIYTVPSNESSGNIAGMGVASDDVVFVWYYDWIVSAGYSRQLDYYRDPYSYSLP